MINAGLSFQPGQQLQTQGGDAGLVNRSASPVQEAISERRLTAAFCIQISPIPRFPQAESDFP